MSGANPVDRLKYVLDSLSAHCSHNVAIGEDIEGGMYDQLEEMMEWCEDIDIACGKLAFTKTTSILHCNDRQRTIVYPQKSRPGFLKSIISTGYEIVVTANNKKTK